MEKNLIGTLKIMKDLNIKPNFSALQREFKIDRHTIKKYYDYGGIPIRKERKRMSLWDPYYDEIKELLSDPKVSKRAAYQFLSNKYGDELPGTYGGFRTYTLRRDISATTNTKAHVLYETEPGDQIQVDWKENMTIHLKSGKEIKFNVFTATLGYSREHVFVYSTSKTTEDFVRCLIQTFRTLGGVTNSILTDNMSSIVTINNKKKTVYPKITQLIKDLNTKLILCKVKTPETKGKDENSNKFIKWIYPYDYKLESEEELIHLIENTICGQCNQQINTATKLPPAALFQKEKEYLKPLPSNILLESYIEEHYVYTVPPTLLIRYKGNQYSVPKKYINQKVHIYAIENKLWIYNNASLIATHNITQKSVNYNEEHYKEALKDSIRNKELDIDEAAKKNLSLLSKLGNKL